MFSQIKSITGKKSKDRVYTSNQKEQKAHQAFNEKTLSNIQYLARELKLVAIDTNIINYCFIFY